MSEIKLLPCPFCGGEARLQTLDGSEDGQAKCINYEDELHCGYSFVHCYGCDTDFMHHGEYAKDVLEAWNTRKPMQEIVKKLEEWKNSSLDSLEKCAFEKAIEIVKRGGVDEQID